MQQKKTKYGSTGFEVSVFVLRNTHHHKKDSLCHPYDVIFFSQMEKYHFNDLMHSKLSAIMVYVCTVLAYGFQVTLNF